MRAVFVESGAVITGWSAQALDTLMSRHLPRYLATLSPQQRAELDATHAAIHRAAGAYQAGRLTVGVRRRTSDIPEVEFSAASGHEVSTREAADMLDVTPRQVCRLAAVWAADGLARQVGRSWLVDRDAVVAYQDQQGRRTA